MKVEAKSVIKWQGERNQPGAIVDLPDDMARDLINNGLAVAVKSPAKAPESTPTASPTPTPTEAPTEAPKKRGRPAKADK